MKIFIKPTNQPFRLTILMACVLWVAACLPTAEPPPQPSTPLPPATATPSVLVPTTTAAPPTPLRDTYDQFLRILKSAIEKNDEVTLKNLFALNWFSGRYRADSTQYKSIDDAAAAFKLVRQGATITVDLERPAVEPAWAQKYGERVIVARWQTSDGRDEFAHLYASRVNGDWRWVALITGIPYYHSPSVSLIRLNPSSFAGREVMLVGEYRGHDKEFKDAPPEGSHTFVIKDASGASVWITATLLPGQELPFKPDDPSSLGKPVRVIGIMQDSGGRPFVVTDSATLVTTETYVNVTGMVKEVAASARVITVFTNSGVPRALALFETSTVDYADGRPANLAAVTTNTKVTALGRPTTGDSILAEQIFILPPTALSTPTAPTTLPPTSANRLAFARGNQLYVRDLRSNADTLIAEGGTQWDWSRDGLRAVFVRGVGPASEIWSINSDGSNEKRLTNDNLSDGAPRWSPDGLHIAYEHNVQVAQANTQLKLKGEVWLMNFDGSSKRKVADGYDPAWSPDGQRIAFASNPTVVKADPKSWLSYSRNGIHLMNAQGRNQWAPISTDTPSAKFTVLEWQMNQARVLDSPHWSPDGKEITLRVLDTHGAYVTTNPASGGFGKFIALYFDDIARGFTYSPDGNYIAIGSGGLSDWETVSIYRRNTIGRDGVTGASFRTMGRLPRQSTEAGQTVKDYVWSLDSSRVAYTIITYPNNDTGKPPVNAGIWLMDIASGESKQLIADGSGPLLWLP